MRALHHAQPSKQDADHESEDERGSAGESRHEKAGEEK
jgi:hypothetical protein